MNSTKPVSNPARVFARVMVLVLSVAVVGMVLSGRRHVKAMNGDAKPTQTAKPEQGIKPAEQVYKNIQIFKGTPASELESTMAFISGSLGVKCNYCHTNPFEKDEKQTKQTARQMIRMVLELNKGSFSGEKAVTCFTCHRGKPLPVSVPTVGQNLWQPGPAAVKETPPPTIEEILDRYVQAVGGEANIRKVTSRVARGSRIGADGVLVPEEVYQKAPNQILTITMYPDNSFSTGFNGSTGWGSSSKSGTRELPAPVLAQLKADAEFYRELNLRKMYSKLTVTGRSTIGDRDVYVVRATPASGDPVHLYFDAQSGLLVRKYVESEMFLGKFPLQTDYEDYRDVDGVKQPFLIRWAMPGRTWGRQIATMNQNVPIDDSQFNPPATRP